MAAGGGPPLALAGPGAGPGGGRGGGGGARLGEGTGRPLLDALPYADPLDTALRARAEALVREEVRSPLPSSPSSLPPPPPPPPPLSHHARLPRCMPAGLSPQPSSRCGLRAEA